MTAFWIMIATLLVLASLALILPLWRGEGQQGISRSALNKRLYRQRLLELDEEQDQGVLAEASESVIELQRSLLDDIPDLEQTARLGRSQAWIPGVLVLLAVSFGLYFKLGAWQEVQRWQDIGGRMDELNQRILVDRDAEVSEQDLHDFMLGLRTILKDDPSDYHDWLALGQLSIDDNNPEMARDALKRAYDLASRKETVAVSYAQALMMTGDNAQAERLLQIAIAVDPKNIEARSLYAFMAQQNEQYQTAIDRWQRLLPLLEKGSAHYNKVERSMDYARQQLKQQG